MALYRFRLQSHLSTQAVLEAVRKLTRERPGFWQSLKESFASRPDGSPPFIGTVEGNEFTLYRDIRYRNSFLPRIKGYVGSDSGSTQVDVVMSLHPFVLLFMLFWLGGVGYAAFAILNKGMTAEAAIPLGMFLFGVALTLGGFYPEAIKARRLLEQHIGQISASPMR